MSKQKRFWYTKGNYLLPRAQFRQLHTIKGLGMIVGNWDADKLEQSEERMVTG